MNALQNDMKKLIEGVEKEARAHVQDDPYRLKFHLMPQTGWLNDPNGLCFYKGEYHVFFQYSPFDSGGSLKFWGHYKSKDLISWEYLGVALYPDQPYDIHGAYSGSAFVEDDTMYLFYTGNVKQQGDFNYITEGREGNTVLAVSEDGINFSHKQLLMTNADYPVDLTCHIRDPKVFKKDDVYYMVQGARTKDDIGEVLLFASPDKYEWSLKNRIKSQDKFGFMWECPDFFVLGDKQVLMVSPQGVEADGILYQNIYQSGYYFIEGDFRDHYSLNEFCELDHGFDFYAPQTFEDGDGRRIMIGWMGLPDIEEEYQNPTVSTNWQHALTIPRELKIKDGRLYQVPVEEINQLFTDKEVYHIDDSKEEFVLQKDEAVFMLDTHIQVSPNYFELLIKDGIKLEYKKETSMFTLSFDSEIGYGRTSRSVILPELSRIQIFCDTSSLEIFLNDGEEAFTTRYYSEKKDTTLTVKGDCNKIDIEWNSL